MYSNWPSAAMALYRMEGFENRLHAAIKASDEIFTALNKVSGIRINPLEGGTNLYALELSKEVDGKKMQETLNMDFNIRIPGPDDKNRSLLTINETLLYQNPAYIINAFKKSI